MKGLLSSVLSLGLFLSSTNAVPAPDGILGGLLGESKASAASPAVAAAGAAGTPLPPTEDPFYKAPAGYATKENGAILKARKAPAPFATGGKTVVEGVKATYQFMYKSTDTFGNASATITTIIVPENAKPNQLLSYQLAEDAAYLNCAPSYLMQENSNKSAQGSSIVELQFLKTAVSNGWIINLPDFLGPKSAFLANTQAGHATLDSIKAALTTTEVTGIEPGATVVMWGYSGGSIASGWAAELQPEYAPDLKIAGAVLGGTVPSINDTLFAVNSNGTAGLIISGIQGLGNEYPDLATLIPHYLRPNATAGYEAASTKCLTGDVVQYANQDVITNVLTDRTILWASKPNTATEIINANKQGKKVPKIPLLIYKGEKDQISPIPASNELVQFYCDGGAQLEYVTSADDGHITLLIKGGKPAMTWIADRFAGKTLPAGCTYSQDINSLETRKRDTTSVMPSEVESELANLLASASAKPNDSLFV